MMAEEERDCALEMIWREKYSESKLMVDMINLLRDLHERITVLEEKKDKRDYGQEEPLGEASEYTDGCDY